MDEDVKKYELAEADYISGMKYKAIADKYGVSMNTVKSWKKRYEWNREKGAHKNEKGCTQNNRVAGNRKKQEDVDEYEVISDEALTDKQRLFCVLYIRCFNATKAYIKAYGCNYNTAAVNAHRMLRNAKIKQLIDELKQNRLNQEMLSEDDIVQKYIDILYADITDYVDTTHNMIDLSGPLADGSLIKKVSFGKVDSVELLDKMQALKWLGEHMDLATEKQRAEIDLLRSKINDDSDQDENTQKVKGNIENILGQMQDVSQEDIL